MNIVWSITKLECKAQDGPYADVVVTAHWSCDGTDGGFNARVYGDCVFPTPSSTFVPYADLTQDQILAWCWANGVEKAITEDVVIAQLNALTNPPVVALPLPWVTPAV